MELTNYNKAKADVCRMVIENSRKRLKTPGDRIRFNVKWKREGARWVATSVSKQHFTAASKTTGDLARSMRYEVKENDLIIKTLNYGRWVDLGRKPGKYVPVKDLEAWMDKKGIKVSSFLLNRKIKFFGIEATKFLTNAIIELGPDMPEILMDAYMEDLVIEMQRLLSVKEAIKDIKKTIVRGRAESLTGGYFRFSDYRDKTLLMRSKPNKTDEEFETLRKREEMMRKMENDVWKNNFLSKRATGAADVWLLKKLRVPGLKSVIKIPAKAHRNYSEFMESKMSLMTEITES